MSWTQAEYNEDGRNTVSEVYEITTRIYNAAGQLIKLNTHLDVIQQSEIERILDGDGRELKRKKKTWIDASTPYWQIENDIYYIRSSVLGGEVVSEATNTGRKGKTYVLAAGTRIAGQWAYFDSSNVRHETVYFEHQDVSGMSRFSTASDGTILGGTGWEGAPAELDALGGNVGTTTPYTQEYPSEQPSPFLALLGEESPLYVNGRKVGCNQDGVSISCNVAFAALQNGSAVVAPSNLTVRVIYRDVAQFAFFNAFADGFSGFIPRFARYLGNGVIGPRLSKPILRKAPGGRYIEFPNDTNLAELNKATGEMVKEGIQVLKFTGDDAFWQSRKRYSHKRIEDNVLDFWRNLLKEALSRPKCKEFIDKYVGGENLLRVFDLVRVQQGFSYAPIIGAVASGNINMSYGAGIEFSDTQWQFDLQDNRNSSLSAMVIIPRLIHELIHVARNGGNDFWMQAKVYSEREKFSFPYTDENMSQASHNWSQVLASYCGITSNGEILRWWKGQ